MQYIGNVLGGGGTASLALLERISNLISCVDAESQSVSVPANGYVSVSIPITPPAAQSEVIGVIGSINTNSDLLYIGNCNIASNKVSFAIFSRHSAALSTSLKCRVTFLNLEE